MRRALKTITAIAAGLALAPATAQAAVTIGPAAQSLGEDAGTATFTVTRDTLDALQASTVTVTLDANDPATCPADVSPCSQSVALGVTETSKAVSFAIVDDRLNEGNESVDARVTAATTGETSLTPATLTILDNDPLPTLSVAPAASFAEGTSPPATTTAPLAVTLSAPSGRAVTATYTVTAGTASASDDVTVGTGQVTVPAGASSAAIPLTLVADGIDEQDETFTVTLAAPVFATLANAASTVTLADDDEARLVVSPASVREGTGGQPPVAAFLVGLTAPSDRPITASYASSSGSAVSGVDFAPTSGSITFAPGETLKSFGVPIAPDASDEPDETFGVTLSDAGATALQTPTNTGTIVDDDEPAATVPSTNVTFPGLGTSGGATITGVGGADRTPPASRITRLTFRKPNLLSATVTCPAPETSCSVRLTVFTAPARRSRVPKLRRERRLVSVRASIPGGGSRVVRARISKANVTLLRKAKTKIGLRSFAVVRDASGNVGTAMRATAIRP